MGEPNRLRILCNLGMDCRPVTKVIRATGLEQTNASFHLRILREAGLVRPERRGPFIYYSLRDPQLLDTVSHLNGWQSDCTSRGETGRQSPGNVRPALIANDRAPAPVNSRRRPGAVRKSKVAASLR